MKYEYVKGSFLRNKISDNIVKIMQIQILLIRIFGKNGLQKSENGVGLLILEILNWILVHTSEDTGIYHIH
jgi:hypothetical protein